MRILGPTSIHNPSRLCETRRTMKFLPVLPRLAALAAALPLLFFPLPATHAQSLTSAGFQSYLQLAAARARNEGVSEATISRTLSGLTMNPRVIQLDRRQPGRRATPPPMAPYIRRHVDSARISGGKAKYRQVSGLLPGIERRFRRSGQDADRDLGPRDELRQLHRQLRSRRGPWRRLPMKADGGRCSKEN